MTNPFTGGPEWKGWTISKEPSGWRAKRALPKGECLLSVWMSDGGTVYLCVHEEIVECNYQAVTMPSIEPALRAAEAIAEGAGGWQ